MTDVSIIPHAEFGLNDMGQCRDDHREDTPNFTSYNHILDLSSLVDQKTDF